MRALPELGPIDQPHKHIRRHDATDKTGLPKELKEDFPNFLKDSDKTKIPCPISLKKKARIRVRRFSFLSFCP